MSNQHKKRQEEKRMRKEQQNSIVDNKQFRARNKRIINYGIAIILIVLVSYGLYKIFQTDNGPGPYDALAQCMTSKGAIMYGTQWCSHCQAQKKLFGNSFRHIKFIDCDENAIICDLAGVKGFPTWIFSDGTKVSGELTLEKLAEKTECSLSNSN